MEIQLSYQDLKTVVTNKNLYWQYEESTAKYDIWTLDTTIAYQTIVWKAGYESLDTDTGQNTTDRTDFETNYKSGANKRLNMLQPFSDNLVEFKGLGTIATATKNSTTDIDLVLSEARLLNGGHMYADKAILNDYIVAQVVDVDDILGYGAGFVAKEWITKWYVIPNIYQRIETPQAGEILAGLYLRLKYTSTGTVDDVTILVNYNTFKKL